MLYLEGTIDVVMSEIQLRSKRRLIEKFIDDNLQQLQPTDNVITAFEGYWSSHRKTAFEQLCADEKIQPEQLQKLLQDYEYYNRMPRPQEIKDALTYQPRVLERKTILGRVAEKIQLFIDTFIEGMGGIL